MISVIASIIKDVLPKSFQKADLFEPFCEQVAALQAAKLQKYLLNAESEGEEGKDTIQIDEEVKQETIRDFLYELYDDVMKGIKEETSDDSLFVDEASDILNDLESFAKKPIVIPIYNCSLSKRKGGKGKGNKKSSNDMDKVINPLTGNKITVDGRLYKKLIVDGFLTEDGEMTEEGREKYDDVLAKKPKKIAHPKRKGGKINLGGKAYKSLLEEGYFYNEETETWIEPPEDEDTEKMESESSEESDASEDSEESDASEEPEESDASEEKEIEKKSIKKQRKISEKVPHPEIKNRQIVKNGKVYQRYLDEGWLYDEEEGVWYKEE